MLPYRSICQRAFGCSQWELACICAGMPTPYSIVACGEARPVAKRGHGAYCCLQRVSTEHLSAVIAAPYHTALDLADSVPRMQWFFQFCSRWKIKSTGVSECQSHYAVIQLQVLHLHSQISADRTHFRAVCISLWELQVSDFYSLLQHPGP